MEIVSLNEARQKSLQYYFTGKPCKNGHISRRVVKSRHCEACFAEYHKNYYQKNIEKYKKRDAAYYRANKEAILQRQKKFFDKNPGLKRQRRLNYKHKHPERLAQIMRNNYLNNRDHILERHKQRYRENPAKSAAKVALRRSRKVNACPSWFGELDQFIWQEAAELRKIRIEQTGIGWHVDNMIPLAARNACGLHVGENCQVIPSYLNLWKNNKMQLTKHLEWVRHL